MRWALSHIVIACFGGKVPQKPSKSTVEGILLHDLLECYDQYSKKPAEERFRPRAVLLELVDAWNSKNEGNPRINSRALTAQIGIEDILRAFAEAAKYIQQPEYKGAISSTADKATKPVGVGSHSEVWLRDPESKLCGRADHIRLGEIIDFKTGDEHADHRDQVLFYAALYFALTGEIPRALRIIYARRDLVVDVTPVAPIELKQRLAVMRQRVLDVDRRIVEGDMPAKPEADKCARCHVRALCDTYWEWRDLCNAQTDQSNLVDYRPSHDARVELAGKALHIRDAFGGDETYLYLPNHTAVKLSNNPKHIRVLSLRARNEKQIVRLTFTQATEIYLLG